MAAAEEYNDPGHFTTFIAYEWTSLVKGNNLHRNVIFRDGPERAGKIVPYTTTPPIGSRNPRDLWKWLQNYEDTTGGDVLAIPHNGNLSNGMMFALQDDFDNGKALDAEYATTRQKWERLYEATQIKGDGEAHPFLSPEDEFADFETWDWGNLDASEAKTKEMLPGEYARSGLLRGLELEAKLGVNPFKFGLVGASDTHTGLSPPDNDNFFGKFTGYEPNPHRATHLAKENKENGVSYRSWRYITGWPDRRLGGVEHAWCHLRRDGASRGLRHHRPAHAGALLRWLGIQEGRREPPRPCPARLQQGRADGIRPHETEAAMPKRPVSSSTPCAMRWVPTWTASRSSRAGSAPTASRRNESTTSPFPTDAKSGPTAAARHRSATRSICPCRAGRTPSEPPNSAASGPTLTSTRS